MQHDSLSSLHAGDIFGRNLQLDPDLIEAGNRVECRTLGDHLACGSGARDDHASSGRLNINGNERLGILDAGHDLTGGDFIAERLLGLHDDARKTCGGTAHTVQVEANSPIDLKGFVQLSSRGLLHLYAGLGGGRSGDYRLHLRRSERPLMHGTGMVRDNDVVEGMGLDDLVVAAGEIALGRKGEAILDLARTDQGDG